MKNNVILLFICLLLTSCMTSKYAQKMQSLQIGMTPNQVIAIMGSPQSVQKTIVYIMYIVPHAIMVYFCTQKTTMSNLLMVM